MMLVGKKLAAAVGAAALMMAMTATAQDQKAPETTLQLLPSFDKSSMDMKADPCQDFYKFACGNFAANHPIPSDMAFLAPYMILREYDTQLLRGILEKTAAGNVVRTPNEQKIGDYYAACMNTDLIEKEGTRPIALWLKKIDEQRGTGTPAGRKQFSELVGELQRFGVNVFFGYGEQQDFKDAQKQIAIADQGGLGLPEKDYYLRTGAKDAEIRTKYEAHVAKMLELAGEQHDAAASDAQNILAMETELAKASMGRAERRDPQAIYHMESFAQFAATAPDIDFALYAKATGAPQVRELNVATPNFFPVMDKEIASTPLATLKAYMKYQLLTALASRLPKAFDDENFHFYSTVLSGVTEKPARWKRCSRATDGALGEALGQVYVKDYFPPDDKAKVLSMVKNIEGAMGEDIQQITWMSPETKVKATEKLHLVANKIGYPDHWRDYSKLIVKRDDPLGNMMRANIFENDRQFNKIGKPVDRGEWDMTPPTVNAYYNPSMNDINFPAGYLQSPEFDPKASDPLNYGHVGATIGHELTHGFDDEGAQFDGHGNLSDWWTAQDKTNFKERTACMAAQYDKIVVVDDLHVNGKLTLGEDVADNGGLLLSFMAYMKLAKDAHVDMTKKTDGFTPEQLFYIAYAQDWCSNWRPEMLRNLVQTDPHPPDKARVNGVLQNQPDFGRVFGCKVGTPMVPEKNCRIW